MVYWITLGDINKYLFFPFVGGMVTILFILIMGQFDQEFKRHPLIRGVNSGMGMCLSLIPFLIIHNRTKSMNKEISKFVAQYKNTMNEEKKTLIKGKYLLLLICAFLDFLQKELSFIVIHDSENNVWIFNLLYFTFFSWFILNQKFYMHQFLSLGLLIILLVAMIGVLDYKTIKEKPYDFFLVLYIELVYSINHVLNKYLMDKKFCSPYEISFYEGLFCLIVNIILLSIFSNIEISKHSGALKVFVHKNYDGKIYIDNFKSYIEKFNTKEFFAFLLSGVNKVSYNLFSLLTIKYFTPAHVIIILFFGEIEYFIVTMRRGNLIFTIFIFILLVLLVLVFTEIIEINIFGISKNTKKNIRERAIREEKEAEYNSGLRGDSYNTKIELQEGILLEVGTNIDLGSSQGRDSNGS